MFAMLGDFLNDAALDKKDNTSETHDSTLSSESAL